MNSVIQSKLQAASTQFTEEVLAIFGEAFSAVAAGLSVATPSRSKKKAIGKAAAKPAAKPAKPAAKPAKPAAKPAKPAAKPAKPAAKPAKPGKRIRRSDSQLQEVAQRVIKLLGSNKKGLRIEQINKQLGTTTKQLARPIQKLMDERKIKKTGEKRATTYFPA